MLPWSQGCTTYGSGTVGIFNDGCNDGAEYGSSAVGLLLIFGTAYVRPRSIFAITFAVLAVFRCFWGTTTGVHQIDAGAMLTSREIFVPMSTFILTTGHISFREPSLSTRGCIAVCGNYIATTALTSAATVLAGTAAVCHASNAAQPLLAFLVFDVTAASIGAIWALGPSCAKPDGNIKKMPK